MLGQVMEIILPIRWDLLKITQIDYISIVRAARLPHLPFFFIPSFAEDQDHLIFVQVCQCSLPRYIDIFQEIFTLSQISYLVCFVLAFKGPNAGVLGNVGNGYWHYQVSTSSS